MFYEPDETRYDLRWRMFGTSVRVHPLFWLVSAILGFDAVINLGVGFLFAWVGCVFFCVLLHEFGHVWMGRLFGSRGRIVLISFGGLAIGSNRLDRRWQRILVSLAGPGIQLVFLAILWFGRVWVLDSTPPASQRAVGLILRMLILINFYWPILNLLPIWPLDGGQVVREVCQGIAPVRGVAFSLGISMVVSGVLAVHGLMASQGRELLPSFVPAFDMFTALFFAWFCVNSFQTMQIENQRRYKDFDDWS